MTTPESTERRPLLSLRSISETTALVILEAAVWTLVGYLSRVLLLTTTVFAITAILALNAESYLANIWGKTFAKRARVCVLTAFVLSLLCTFIADQSPAPFNATIVATTNYVGSSPVSLFMVAYDSSHGPTASPVCYLAYMQFVNRQNFEVRIASYSVAIKHLHYSPLWYKLRSIPLELYPVYAIGIPAVGSETPGMVYFPRGTYLLTEHPELEGRLAQSRMMRLEPLFDTEIEKPIPPHHTIEGWAAFDRAGDEVPKLGYFRISIADTEGNRSTVVVQTPLPTPEEFDMNRALIQPTPIEHDLSSRYLKFYGNRD